MKILFIILLFGFTITAASVADACQTISAKNVIEYTDIIITKPYNGETIRNNGGVITIETSAELLHNDHEFVLLFDNKEVLRSKVGKFTLQNVYRGAHILNIGIVDKMGNIIIQSKNLVVYVFRATIHRIH